MADGAFELRSLPSSRGKARLFLLQLPFPTQHIDKVDQPTTIGQLDGSALEDAREPLAELLPRQPGLPETQLGEKDEVLRIEEELALRLALIFNSINRLRSQSKMRKIIKGVQTLPQQAAAYWVQEMARGQQAAQKALETLLIERG